MRNLLGKGTASAVPPGRKGRLGFSPEVQRQGSPQQLLSGCCHKLNVGRRYWEVPPHPYSGPSFDSVVVSPPENRDGCGRYPFRVRTLYFFS